MRILVDNLTESGKMTEIDYQHECSRAELLGLPKPSRDEFFSRRREVTNEENVEEDISAEEAEEAGVRQEGLSRVGGGLDELNSILSSTQKKLNRFKTVCGSFSNLLKLQIGTKKDENEKKVDLISNSPNKNQKGGVETTNAVSVSPQVQMKKGEDTQMDKLDSLINKAERAELSLSSQNKQMKKFLN